MKVVRITLSNIQSHECTSFTLRPGMNFILSEGNNVGKSAIFRVLTAIAKAPYLGGQKLGRLIRRGCSKGSARFEFDNQCVTAWIVKSSTGESAEIFFETISEVSKEVIRSNSCPQDLLDALGIAVDAHHTVLNFNDADSVQLISEHSTEADAILEYVMLDSDVEKVKVNISTLSREMQKDYDSVCSQLEFSRSQLGGLHYTPAVEEFFKEYEYLDVLTSVVDGLTSIAEIDRTTVYPGIDFDIEILEVLKEVAPVVEASTIAWHEIPSWAMITISLLQESDICGVFAVPNVASSKLLGWAEILYKISRLLATALYECSLAENARVRIERNTVELARVSDILNTTTKVVACPVKGEVWFTSEECISCST